MWSNTAAERQSKAATNPECIVIKRFFFISIATDWWERSNLLGIIDTIWNGQKHWYSVVAFELIINLSSHSIALHVAPALSLSCTHTNFSINCHSSSLPIPRRLQTGGRASVIQSCGYSHSFPGVSRAAIHCYFFFVRAHSYLWNCTMATALMHFASTVIIYKSICWRRERNSNRARLVLCKRDMLYSRMDGQVRSNV